MARPSARGALKKKLIALGANKHAAGYAEQQLAKGNKGPLMLMLLARGMLEEVIDEAPRAGKYAWIEKWRRYAPLGFPVDLAALERLLAAGADPAALTDVVRSAQLITAYNFACAIDDSASVIPSTIEVPEGIDWALMHPNAEGVLVELGELHEEIMSWDKSGRGGAPRSRETATTPKRSKPVRTAKPTKATKKRRPGGRARVH